MKKKSIFVESVLLGRGPQRIRKNARKFNAIPLVDYFV
eukprot:CAMPEP_0170481970 /NCGR_PEP_ID=MMETSP0208-20121228/2199_1 /TAXON_ID=197538 /ORGANISM="Strombidium inclinatum, Strain S3" /LENGTH=37 /DNA_ID= /DNA_START= /DNA_END= /DNA_ORIENTATION=